MLAPHIKRNVDKLWNQFWTAGITNPLVAVEQITYLLFLKRLEAINNERVKKGRPTIYKGKKVENGKEVEVDYDNCRWRFIEQDKTPQHLINVVFPWLRDLEKHFSASEAPANGIEAIGGRMSDAYFQLDPNKGAILQQAIDLINKLFARVDTQGAATDIMGDTFEYLLSEIATAGKNGQFRTPRHIIRTMVQMLDPQPGEHVIDPAAGTGGFLFSSLSHILARHTEPEQLRIEWDGTPHRAYGDRFTPEEFTEVHRGDYYTGLDNDRTMVRIGWMNMILHGIENPQIHQRDSLGKRRDDDTLKPLLESEGYDIVLANPPFTGTVDSEDLDTSLFPKAGKSGKKAKQVITNKSELLFVWRMLDLLRVGGRCAVIVPEGVLFGNTTGHLALRQELLAENKVEAVISLPAGVFQPYTGVKTSILVFQKETRKEKARGWKPLESPRTQRVWFYEVEQEALTLDAKRNERRDQDNDLWDLLEKYKTRNQPEQHALDYFQPGYHSERWRMVDEHTLKVFADEAEVPRWKNQVAAVSELFEQLPADPEAAHQQIEAKQRPKLTKLGQAAYAHALAAEQAKARKPNPDALLKKAETAWRRLCEAQPIKDRFDQEEKVAWPLWQKAHKAAAQAAAEHFLPNLQAGNTIKAKAFDEAAAQKQLAAITTEYARLDGYDVMLRGLESLRREGMLKEAKHWTAPVRVYAEDPDWQSEDGGLKGSHDQQGQPRPEYLTGIELYDAKGKLNEGLLDPDCIEARGWNLSASQYKPFNFEAVVADKSVAEMIRELKAKETQIMDGLDRLLAMVEGEE
jgi:type I restriction enzyme M protein